ncbi:MAG TPA: hypothetical protein VNM24_13285 [Burkholderiales bacterium]|nr:hypothetical protein [Burkholderiales bacterium]
MRRASLPAAACFAAVCFLTAALAHREGEVPAAAWPFDCEHPPADAVTRLPLAIEPFAQLSCLPIGQIIVAREGWVWRYPASYFDQPLIAAYSPMASRAEPGARYFTSLSVEELSGDAALRRNDALVALLPNYRPDAPPKRVLRLEAANELGHRFEVYFPMTDANSGWGAICAPECTPEMLFMMYKSE